MLYEGTHHYDGLTPYPDGEFEYLPDEDGVVLYPGSTLRVNIWCAVLASKKIPYSVEMRYGENVIIVNEMDGESAQREIDSYEENNVAWPPPRNPISTEKAKKPLFTSVTMECGVSCMLLLAGLHARANLSENTALPWREAGVWNAAKVISGEWWRLFTALTLHSDELHLLSNLFWIAFLVAVLGCDIGGGLAMLFMIISGAMANATMIILGATHSSLGASTMVFSLIGMICSIRTVDVFKTRISDGGNFVSLLPWVPIFTGVVMFGFYGTAPGSDVLAHAMGLICGMLIGIPAFWLEKYSKSRIIQLPAGIASVLAVAVSWYFALENFK